jgi:hypothetical protein
VPLRTNTYAAPDWAALLSLWFPSTPVALLSSPTAPTTTVSSEADTDHPSWSSAPVFEALR